jgi:hypothetical protein
MSLSKSLTAAAGNAAAGNPAAGDNLYVEDVFSTYLYDGTGASHTITNGIDLDGEGGMVWTKGRNAAQSHGLWDTDRGVTKYLVSENTNAQATYSGLTAFNSNGFTLGSGNEWNQSGNIFASWTFRKAEKFFDVVTYTGNGTAGRTVAHNLGSVPAMMIVKCSTTPTGWAVYHSSLGATKYLQLDVTSAAGTSSVFWNDTAPTDSVFTVGSSPWINTNGDTYVAYLFASDAGGFGDDGDENIIKCGSWDATGTNEVNLGFEPQWILIKNADGSNNWGIFDTMREWTADGNIKNLKPNLSALETSESGVIKVTSTGFTWVPAVSGNTYIYIAIRRPMKTPESGTEVFAMNTPTSTTNPTWNSGFVTDFAWYKNVDAVYGNYWYSRLTGGSELKTNSTDAEIINSNAVWDFMDGFGKWNTGSGVESWMFKRATGFFDVVAYTGDGSAGSTQAHNLGVAPQLIIIKRRNSTSNWAVQSQEDGTKYMLLNHDDGNNGSSLYWNNTAPSATQFTLGATGDVNSNNATYIAYLFGSVDGVSKVGSYTGTGSNVNVDCGFSAGARFILIKRTDSAGDWYVWDSVRGIVAGNDDPYLLLNSTAAEVTSTDYIDPLSSGFTVTSTAPAALNASGGSYLFLAIA